MDMSGYGLSILECIGEGVFNNNLNGLCNFINPAALDILGFTKEEVIGKDLYKLIHHDQDETIVPYYECPVNLTLKDGKCRETEDRFKRKNGVFFYVRLTVTPIFHGNEMVGVSVIFIDITERKNTQKKFYYDAKCRLIVENVTDLISVLDVNKTLLYISLSHETVLGYNPKDIEGKYALDFIHDEDKFEVNQRFLTMLKTKEPTISEYRYIHADGHEVFIEAKWSPVMNDYGSFEKVVIVARDITERKKAEEQLIRSEKLAVIGELAAGVAHEIRNPLTSLKGFLQLLAHNEGNANYCSIMLTELERINGIVSEFLMFAKPQVQNLKPISIRKLLNDVIKLLVTNAIMSSVQIIFEYDVILPLVTGDEIQLKQVFINVLKNALDAISNNGKISIEARMYDEKRIMVRIIDRGCGIPQKRLSKIGEPFFTTKEKGTGLGMMVSKRIMEAHHGEIQIMSEEGIGTIVDIILPIQHGQACD